MSTFTKAALLALACFVVSGAWMPDPALAQGSHCGPRDALVDALSEGYQESPVSRGVTSTGALLEIFAGPSGSWSILVTVPGGPTCLVSSGEGWRRLPLAGEDHDPAV
ncbi:hypothetical protein HBA54_00050 [Pelagibius litoralis]|uniref:Lipoprotein n=1 Tax=Pelagibius litoralis TaxID=374515 RepID=A0A967EWI1_9PROT|nr:hypothetical protein [Pelagibius litoralis]NIA66978.1 hypothetical protein [Pelagibius litoralis]